jgi:hypothetical protein
MARHGKKKSESPPGSCIPASLVTVEAKSYLPLQNRERWCDHYETMHNGVLAAIPWPVRSLVGVLAYRGMVRTLYGQGTGRYTDAEVQELKQEVWEAIDALLTDSRTKSQSQNRSGLRSARVPPFWVLGGTEPSEADATVYGFVVSGLVCKA